MIEVDEDVVIEGFTLKTIKGLALNNDVVLSPPVNSVEFILT